MSTVREIDEPGLPPGWKALFDSSTNSKYYWDTVANRTTYERPSGGELALLPTFPIRCRCMPVSVSPRSAFHVPPPDSIFAPFSPPRPAQVRRARIGTMDTAGTATGTGAGTAAGTGIGADHDPARGRGSATAAGDRASTRADTAAAAVGAMGAMAVTTTSGGPGCRATTSGSRSRTCRSVTLRGWHTATNWA